MDGMRSADLCDVALARCAEQIEVQLQLLDILRLDDTDIISVPGAA